MRQHSSLVALLGVGLLSAGALVACSSDGAQGDSDVKVVATTTQLCDYTTQLAKHTPSLGLKVSNASASGKGEDSEAKEGDGPHGEIELTCLLAPNASAHEAELTAQQMQSLASADLLLTNGVDLERFLDTSIESSGFKGLLVVSSGVPNTGVNSDDKPYTTFDGDEKVQVAPWPFAPEPGHAPEFKNDPHVWTSPENAKIQVNNVAKALAAKLPDEADAINKGNDGYQRELDELTQWVKTSIETVPAENRVLFTSHDAFGYFSQAFGVNFIGAALSDFNSQQDATAEHISQAAEEVRKSHAKALFAENSNNAKSIEAVARAAGVKAITDDDALYGDSLGPQGSEGETYVGSIVHNVRTMVTAWDGKPAPLPSTVQEDLGW